MLIDGFTVVAQIINFLILLFLLRRFLYGPIVRVMNERQAKIAAQIAEVESLKQEAVDEAEAYRQQRDEIQDQREEMLFKTKEAAEVWRKEFLSKARQEIDEARINWHMGIEKEKQAFIQEMRRQIGKQVYSISRQALADLADAELEQQVVQVFLRRLQEMEKDEQKILIEAIEKSPKHIILRSAFEISTPIRQNIHQTVQQFIGSQVDIDFKVNSDLLCGVELNIQDYELAWTLDDYLVSLEESLFETLSKETERTHAE